MSYTNSVILTPCTPKSTDLFLDKSSCLSLDEIASRCSLLAFRIPRSSVSSPPPQSARSLSVELCSLSTSEEILVNILSALQRATVTRKGKIRCEGYGLIDLQRLLKNYSNFFATNPLAFFNSISISVEKRRLYRACAIELDRLQRQAGLEIEGINILCSSFAACCFNKALFFSLQSDHAELLEQAQTPFLCTHIPCRAWPHDLVTPDECLIQLEPSPSSEVSEHPKKLKDYIKKIILRTDAEFIPMLYWQLNTVIFSSPLTSYNVICFSDSLLGKIAQQQRELFQQRAIFRLKTVNDLPLGVLQLITDFFHTTNLFSLTTS